MFVNMLLMLCLLALLNTVSFAASGTTINLSDTSLESIYTSKSILKKETENKKLLGQQVYESILTPYRWSTGFDLSQENDRSDSTSTLLPINSIKNRYAAYLSKKFSSGTSSYLELVRTEYKADTSSNDYYLHSLSLTLEQNLNSLWSLNSDHMAIELAQTESLRSDLQLKIDNYKNLRSLSGIYWQIKSLLVSARENSEVFKKYEKLVKVVESKRSNNYAAAGELEQALAEYISRKNQLADEEQNLQQKILDFKNELSLSEDVQLELDPSFAEVNLPNEFSGKFSNTDKSLSKIKLQKLKASSAELSKKIAAAKDSFKLTAYGKLNPLGVDATASPSLTEMQRFEKNKYSIGIKLDYTLDDQTAKSELAYKNAQALLESQRYDLLEKNYLAQIKNQYLTLKNKYANIAASTEVVKLRERALIEISKSYTQGRTDISNLIDAYNKKITAKVNLAKAYADYYDNYYLYQELTDKTDE